MKEKKRKEEENKKEEQTVFKTIEINTIFMNSKTHNYVIINLKLQTIYTEIKSQNLDFETLTRNHSFLEVL